MAAEVPCVAPDGWDAGRAPDTAAPVGQWLENCGDCPPTGTLTDPRDLLDRVGRRAGWQDGEIRTRPFRVTYATARLQTLDRGAPVSPWTVEKELGHGSRDMLEEVYGRLGDVRHRSEAVEYRVEQHFDWNGEAWVPKKQSAPIIGAISPAA